MEVRKNIVIKNYLGDINNCDGIYYLEDGFLMHKDGKYGVIGKDGKELFPFIYSNIEYNNNCIICDKENDGTYVYNRNYELLKKYPIDVSVSLEDENEDSILLKLEKDSFYLGSGYTRMDIKKNLPTDSIFIKDLYRADIHKDLVIGLKYHKGKDILVFVDKKNNVKEVLKAKSDEIRYNLFDDGIVVN